MRQLMVSILIPTYNYSVIALVEELLKQVESTSGSIEIIVCDDASTMLDLMAINEALGEDSRVQYLQNEKNLGRTATRQRLAETAQFEKLLFLDADVMPKNQDFLEITMAHMKKAQLVFGGIAYRDIKPEQPYVLHWSYGKQREEVNVVSRKKSPYISVNSGCLCIDKGLFLKVNAKMTRNQYGLDNYFKQLLRSENASVLHINNPIIHLGLEPTEGFIKKMLNSVETTIQLEKDGLMENHIRPLQKAYQKLKRLGMSKPFVTVVGIFKSRIERNLYSAKPSLRLFDIYRLHYYIKLKS